MLIMHVIIDLGAGGAETMLKRLTTAQLNDSTYRHAVVSLRGLNTVGPQLQELGIEVVTVGMSGVLDVARVFRRLRSIFLERNPDIVQTWMYHADLIGGLAARSAGIRRVIWGVRTSDINPKAGVSKATIWVTRLCAAISSKVPAKIVYVAGSALRVHEQIGYAKSKSVFIPNGYQLPDLVRRRGEKRQKRQELGIPEDAVLIGSVGRFNAQKDHRSFVFAAAELAAREPRAHFLMMGIEIAWSNRELAGWITQSGYRERFHLLGERRDVIDWLLAIDIFCLHSVGEGFPNVLAEAMSAGVPCITTDVGDAAYLIGDTGAVVQPGDVLAIVRCLEALIAAGEAERERLGQAARDRIAANFSIDAISNRFKELYAEMMHLAADASADREPVAVH